MAGKKKQQKFLSEEDATKLNILLKSRKKNKQIYALIVDKDVSTILRWCSSGNFPYKENHEFLDDLDFSNELKKLKKDIHERIDIFESDFNKRIDELEAKFNKRFRDIKI